MFKLSIYPTSPDVKTIFTLAISPVPYVTSGAPAVIPENYPVEAAAAIAMSIDIPDDVAIDVFVYTRRLLEKLGDSAMTAIVIMDLLRTLLANPDVSLNTKMKIMQGVDEDLRKNDALTKNQYMALLLTVVWTSGMDKRDLVVDTAHTVLSYLMSTPVGSGEEAPVGHRGADHSSSVHSVVSMLVNAGVDEGTITSIVMNYHILASVHVDCYDADYDGFFTDVVEDHVTGLLVAGAAHDDYYHPAPDYSRVLDDQYSTPEQIAVGVSYNPEMKILSPAYTNLPVSRARKMTVVHFAWARVVRFFRKIW